MMAIAPGDAFLATTGWLQTRRMAVGGIPAGGLVPGGDYWVLSYSGVVGELISCHTPSQWGHLGRVRYLGAVYGNSGETLNIGQFGVTGSDGATDRQAPVNSSLERPRRSARPPPGLLCCAHYACKAIRPSSR
jgi:hypothetical protein